MSYPSMRCGPPFKRRRGTPGLWVVTAEYGRRWIDFEVGDRTEEAIREITRSEAIPH